MTHWSLLFVCLAQEYFWHPDNWVCHYTPPRIYELFSLSPACPGHENMFHPCWVNESISETRHGSLQQTTIERRCFILARCKLCNIHQQRIVTSFWVLCSWLEVHTSNAIENWESNQPENRDWGSHCYSWSLATIRQLHRHEPAPWQTWRHTLNPMLPRVVASPSVWALCAWMG